MSERRLPDGSGDRTGRRAAVPVAVAAALLVALACGGGDEPGPASDASAAGAGASAPAESADHDHADGSDHAHGSDTHTHAAADTLAAGVALAPGDGAGWTGSATLLAVGDSVRVLVAIEGAPAGSRHRSELVAGTCADPGPTLVSLPPVAAGASGAGSSQATVALADLEGRTHGAVRLGGESAACGDVHLQDGGHRHAGGSGDG